ncbi:MAG: TauD/TfdA family dioxygenase [Pseudomonadota bacterium]
MHAEPYSPLPDVIEPRWRYDGQVLPSDTYRIDCSTYAMDAGDLAPHSELAERMRRTFEATGLVLLVNTRLTELEAMRGFAKHVMTREMDYTAGANPRSPIETNVYDVGAPLSAWLHYHHEMAYVGASTRMLAFLCLKAVPGRGHTYVSDNLQATEALMRTELGAKLRDLGVCYHRNLTDRDAFRRQAPIGVYNHWQHSMAAEDPTEAEAIAQSRGLRTEWGPNRLLKTRYYASAFEYFPQLDRNLLFCSVADHGVWFDSWPMVMHLPYEERPLTLTFGDDTPFTRDELKRFIDIYDRFGIPIDWRVGDIAVVCNYRFAHGRPAIHLEAGEERELGVMLGEQFDRLGIVPGKW